MSNPVETSMPPGGGFANRTISPERTAVFFVAKALESKQSEAHSIH